jgi:hypothetical protein
MELLKALFESAELPADFKEKTTTLFEAAVDEKVKTEVATLTEGFQNKLEEAKAEFLAEAIKTVDAVIEEAILEWAQENAVALDSEVKGQIAESFLSGLKAVFEKADIELSGDTAGKELVKLQEQNAELVKQAEDTQKALTEAQDRLTKIAIKEIIAEVTAGLADTQAHRVTKLVEAFDFKSAEDFRAKAIMVVEAVGGKIKGTADADGVHIAVDGEGKVTDKVNSTTDGGAGEDGVLVKKPAGNSVTSAEGKTGKPDGSQVLTQPNLPNEAPHMTFTPAGLKEQVDAIHSEAAPHLHSNLVEETLKLFK